MQTFDRVVANVCFWGRKAAIWDRPTPLVNSRHVTIAWPVRAFDALKPDLIDALIGAGEVAATGLLPITAHGAPATSTTLALARAR